MEGNFLLASFVLLGATVALVPLAKFLGLGTILGYLAAGILIGPYGLSLVSDSETIQHIAEFGIVVMLFLIGLELLPRELWRMRHKVIGLGLTQLVGTALIVMALAMALGFAWPSAAIAGLALAMSSTAIGMQTVAQRSITRTETGRSTLAVLLVQDMAVIPILAIIPVLAVMGGSPVEKLAAGAADAAQEVAGPRGLIFALYISAAFLAALVGGRFVIRPLMRFVALAKVREAFTALALLLVVGAALLAIYIGLSPALGAFFGGMLLADSEYRHELESNLSPFRDLLLGLFFISVGMSVQFSVLLEQPLLVLALVMALVGIKIGILFALGTLARMHSADRLLFAILLSQAGEFGFVILQFARNAGRFSLPELEILMLTVALSMATTPLLLLLFDRLWAPRLNLRPGPPELDGPDGQNARHRVIVLGYGRFGQIVTRLLRTQGYEMTLIDDDPAQIELVRRFGVKVFYGDGARLDILRAAGASDASMIVIAVPGSARISAIAELIRRHFPQVLVAARAVDRSHAHDLMALGVHVFERETFRSAVQLGQRALVALGQTEEEARRVSEAFVAHDVKMLTESFSVRHDQAAYIGFVRRSTEMLDEVMRADRERSRKEAEQAAAGAADVDKRRAAGSE